ncbi:MAG: HlyD family efflux transporter periplasmic adaptor subunit [Candidatus Magnetominusculus sp. LBB02]|nr:HlyD family efflux transporter periplasmic adaptor subunit [Candidatus Magnetominusculus sp. LBB02]
MTALRSKHHVPFLLICFALIAAALAGCSRTASNQVQGYVEGEFVYIASPVAGMLDALHVKRGEEVKAGQPLFELESSQERAAVDEAGRRVEQARANLKDSTKGKRPTEIDSLEAQLRQARSAVAFSEKEFERQKKMMQSPGVTSEQELDRARLAHAQDMQRVAQFEAELKTAKLGLRVDQVAAAQANVLATEAALARAQWELSQKTQAAPTAALVFDRLYRQGEWVSANKPVVVLLPAQNIKVRAFVPQAMLTAIQPGSRVQVLVDGIKSPLSGTVSFISPQAEYTPPVIYSKDSRAKMVFMIEAVFTPDEAVKLHPGQPVDVLIGF